MSVAQGVVAPLRESIRAACVVARGLSEDGARTPPLMRSSASHVSFLSTLSNDYRPALSLADVICAVSGWGKRSDAFPIGRSIEH